MLKRSTVFLLSVLATACTAARMRPDGPVTIRVGETRSVGKDGLKVTLRSISPESGCKSKSDCSTMLFNGTVDARIGERSDLISAQAIFALGGAVKLEVGNYQFWLVDVRRDRKGELIASFSLPDVPVAKEIRTVALQKLGPSALSTPSGLQYEVVHQGTGPKPIPGDVVEVRISCTQASGATCDVSSGVQKPISFKVGDVIEGLNEGLTLMASGSTYQFLVPPSLAYGEHPPAGLSKDQVLKYRVELIAIQQRTK